MTYNAVNADKIKVTIQYKTNTFSFETFKYKTLSYIKDKVYNHFYPIRSDINLVYMNKNLSGFELKPLGFFFKTLHKVTIHVKEINYNNMLLQHSSNYSLSERKISLNSSCDDVVLVNTPNMKCNKTKVVMLPHINMNMNMNTSLSNESCNSNSNSSNRRNNKRLFQSKSQNVFMKIRAHQQSTYNIDITCSDCFINLVSYYCRTCCKFICNDCLLLTNESMSAKHYGHKTFRLMNDGNKDSNNVYKRNVSMYKDKLIKELYNVKGEYENVQYKQDKEVDLVQWKEKLLSEVNMIVNDISNNVDVVTKQHEQGNDLSNALKQIDSIEIDKYKDPFEIFGITANNENNESIRH